MKPAELTQLQSLVKNPGSCSYNETNKAKFHRLAKSCLREIAKQLGLDKGTFTIRSNMAGIAVSGEVTLHGDDIYISLSADGPFSEPQFMYRSCKGQKDYTGGGNNWMRYADLSDMDRAIERFQQVRRKAA